MTEREKRLYECFSCKNNGFPGEMVQLAGKTEQGAPIRKNPDDSPHTHRSKLSGARQPQQQQQQQTTIPMTQPLSGSSNNSNRTMKDEEIARMHTENQEDRKAYRDLMRQDVDAKLQIAIAIKALADAIREKSSLI